MAVKTSTRAKAVDALLSFVYIDIADPVIVTNMKREGFMELFLFLG
jgi:hypothetical protein